MEALTVVQDYISDILKIHGWHISTFATGDLYYAFLGAEKRRTIDLTYIINISINFEDIKVSYWSKRDDKAGQPHRLTSQRHWQTLQIELADPDFLTKIEELIKQLSPA